MQDPTQDSNDDPMDDPKIYWKMMRFFSAISDFSKMPEKDKAEFKRMVKEGAEAYERESPNQTLNLIVTDVSEWPAGWPEAIEEIQREMP